MHGPLRHKNYQAVSKRFQVSECSFEKSIAANINYYVTNAVQLRQCKRVLCGQMTGHYVERA